MSVQVLAEDDVAFLESHSGVLAFEGGKRVALDWRRPDGLRLQCSGWTVGEVLNEARASLRRWSGSPGRGEP